MMRLLLFFCWLLPAAVVAQDPAALISQAGQLETAFKENDAFLKYKEVLHIQPGNVTALCKCADFSCRIGNRQSDKTKRIEYFTAGKKYADAAYRLAPDNGEACIVMAMAIGRMALTQGGKEKVAAASDVKRYAERAIRLDSANFKAYHILGRWHYEVSGLNAFERTLAKWFYGALPPASLGQAIACYEKSMALRPSFMLNYIELAKACHRDGQKKRALLLLQRMDKLSDGMLDDTQVRLEGRKLLAEWQ